MYWPMQFHLQQPQAYQQDFPSSCSRCNPWLTTNSAVSSPLVCSMLMAADSIPGHPALKNSEIKGSVGIMVVKKTKDGISLSFAHNTESFVGSPYSACVKRSIADRSLLLGPSIHVEQWCIARGCHVTKLQTRQSRRISSCAGWPYDSTTSSRNCVRSFHLLLWSTFHRSNLMQ